MTARELRALRERLGRTQYEMAAALGINQPHYAKIEAGRWGRAYRLDPDRLVPDEIARRALELRPLRESRLRPTAEELRIRKCIERRVCPFCGRGGWRVLARHTQAVHGVDARTLRELAALPLRASICDPEHADRIRETRQNHLRKNALKGAREAARQLRGTRRTYTRGGVVARARANRKRGTSE